MTDWMDKPVAQPEKPPLDARQIARLLKMMAAFQTDLQLFGQVALIRACINEGDREFALQMWDELSAEEQETVWIAPKFGGIFTTEERRIIKERDIG